MATGYDSTWLEPNPVRREMRRVLSVSTVPGLTGVIESFGPFVFAECFLGLDIARAQSFISPKLAVAGPLTLLVARTGLPFLTRPNPAPMHPIAVVAARIVATVMGGFGSLTAGIVRVEIALIWGSCIARIFVEDWARLAIYRRLDRAPKEPPARSASQ